MAKIALCLIEPYSKILVFLNEKETDQFNDF